MLGTICAVRELRALPSVPIRLFYGNQLLKLLGQGSKVDILRNVVVSSPWLNVLLWGFSVTMSPLGRKIGKA